MCGWLIRPQGFDWTGYGGTRVGSRGWHIRGLLRSTNTKLSIPDFFNTLRHLGFVRYRSPSAFDSFLGTSREQLVQEAIDLYGSDFPHNQFCFLICQTTLFFDSTTGLGSYTKVDRCANLVRVCCASVYTYNTLSREFFRIISRTLRAPVLAISEHAL